MSYGHSGTMPIIRVRIALLLSPLAGNARPRAKDGPLNDAVRHEPRRAAWRIARATIAVDAKQGSGSSSSSGSAQQRQQGGGSGRQQGSGNQGRSRAARRSGRQRR
jgi:hypothetical protein